MLVIVQSNSRQSLNKALGPQVFSTFGDLFLGGDTLTGKIFQRR
jgi:hypothetical protein